jgi:hypothetical protein
MGFLSKFLDVFDWTSRKPRKRFLAKIVDSAPAKESVGDSDFYIVQSGRNKKWAFFRCPSGCGDILNLSLTTERRPRWTVTVDFLSRPTVKPSVRRQEGCYSHFWIRHGVVEWCSDTGIPPTRSRPGQERGPVVDV